MAEFENINSAPQLALAEEIQAAVMRAAQGLLHTNGWRTYTGSHQTKLVEALASLLGANHVGLTCSGSAALELVLHACRLGAGDEVLLSAYDYPGNFAAIERCGLRPALVDVTADSWSISLDSLNETWTDQCRVLVVSHLHGQLQNMSALGDWCRQRDIILIQDACQAVGAALGDKPLAQWADATIISFGGSKTLSAGRGGAWCIQADQLAQYARMAAGVGSGAYELSELQAAMVLAQLPYLEQINERCRKFFSEVTNILRSHLPGLQAPWESQTQLTAFYQAGFLLPSDSMMGHASMTIAPR